MGRRQDNQSQQDQREALLREFEDGRIGFGHLVDSGVVRLPANNAQTNTK